MVHNIPGKDEDEIMNIYKIHIFELRNEEINVKKILAVVNATCAVAKRKPEKIRLYFFIPQFKYMNFIYS